jgi:hypothetical protein
MKSENSHKDTKAQRSTKEFLKFPGVLVPLWLKNRR